MDKKLLQQLQPYVMEPAPLTVDDLPRYVQQELRKIENVLLPMAEGYGPQVFVDLKNPAAPTALTTEWQDVTAYSQEVRSQIVDALSVSVDRDTGQVQILGPGDRSFALFVWATLTLDITAFQQNEVIEARLYSSVDDRSAYIGGYFKSDPKESIATFSAAQVLVIPNDTTGSMQVRASVAGTVTPLSGSFGFRYLNFAQVRP